MSYATAETLRAPDKRTEAELLASTRRSLAQADNISTHTLGTLNEQTEQLRRIQADAEAIDSTLDQSEWLLRGLKPWGWVRNLFRKEPPPGHPGHPGHGHTGPASGPASGPGRPGAKAGAKPGPVAASRGAARLLADEAARAGPRPDQRSPEVDRAYDEIDHMLEGLKQKTQEINRTLVEHNQILPDIAESVSRDHDRIRKQQQEMRRRIG